MTTQPEALRLAKILNNIEEYRVTMTAAAELRRLHEVNQDLLAALKMAYLQNSLDMLLSGDELRILSAAINKATGAFK